MPGRSSRAGANASRRGGAGPLGATTWWAGGGIPVLPFPGRHPRAAIPVRPSRGAIPGRPVLPGARSVIDGTGTERPGEARGVRRGRSRPTSSRLARLGSYGGGPTRPRSTADAPTCPRSAAKASALLGDSEGPRTHGKCGGLAAFCGGAGGRLGLRCVSGPMWLEAQRPRAAGGLSGPAGPRDLAPGLQPPSTRRPPPAAQQPPPVTRPPDHRATRPAPRLPEQLTARRASLTAPCPRPLWPRCRCPVPGR